MKRGFAHATRAGIESQGDTIIYIAPGAKGLQVPDRDHEKAPRGFALSTENWGKDEAVRPAASSIRSRRFHHLRILGFKEILNSGQHAEDRLVLVGVLRKPCTMFFNKFSHILLDLDGDFLVFLFIHNG